MTRTEKLKKLANAIKEYRGSREGKDGRWIRVPKPSALSRVISKSSGRSYGCVYHVVKRLNWRYLP